MHTEAGRGTKARVSRRLLVGLRNLQVILRAPGSHLRAVSRRVAAMERAWGPSEGPREAGISKTLETEASAALRAPGTLWAGSSRCSGRGYRSQPPPRPHSWRGQTPQTCPAGERWQSEPNTAPGDQEEETWAGTLGVGSVLALCSGTALESALSWEMTGQEEQPPSPPGAADGRRAASPPQECHGQAREGRRGPPGRTAVVSVIAPTGTGDCQASVNSQPRDWPWWQFSLLGENITVKRLIITTY